jgi:hypothetical protein
VRRQDRVAAGDLLPLADDPVAERERLGRDHRGATMTLHVARAAAGSRAAPRSAPNAPPDEVPRDLLGGVRRQKAVDSNAMIVLLRQAYQRRSTWIGDRGYSNRLD